MIRRSSLLGFVLLAATLPYTVNTAAAPRAKAGPALQWERLPGPEAAGIIASATDGTRVYAATRGGLFVSADQGQNWSRLPAAPKYIRALAVGGGRVYVHAHVPDSYDFTSGGPFRVFVSADQGANWSEFSGSSSTRPHGQKPFSRLVADAGFVYFVGDSKLLRSPHGSAPAWSNVTPSGIVLESSSANRLFVSGANLCLLAKPSSPGGSATRFYFSADNGGSWMASASDQSLDINPGAVGVNGLAVIGLDQNRAHRSNDGCATFTSQVLPGTTSGNFASAANAGSGKNGQCAIDAQGLLVCGYRFGFLRRYNYAQNTFTDETLSPPQIADGLIVDSLLRLGTSLLAGTIASNDFTRARRFGDATGGAGFYRHDGQNWVPSSNGLATSDATIVDAGVAGALEIFTNGRGLFRSFDGGASYSKAADVGLANSQVATAIRHQNVLLAAIGEPGTTATDTDAQFLFRSTDNGANWTQVLDEGSNSIFALVSDGSSVYATTLNSSRRILYSSNGGQTWAVGSGLPAPADDLVTQGAAAYVYVAGGSSTTYGVYRSSDGGQTWQRASNGLPSQAVSGRLYALPSGLYLTQGNSLYRSADGAANWAAITTAGLPPVSGDQTSDYLAELPGGDLLWFVDVGVSELVGLTFTPRGGHVYRSSNGGASWAYDSMIPVIRDKGNVNSRAVNNVLVKDGKIYVAMRGQGVLAATAGGIITDTQPDIFSFTDVNGVPLSSTQTSNAVMVGGVNAPAAISVSGGLYSIGCTAAGFTSTPGTISNGQTVCVRHTASASNSSTTNTTLTIGGISDTFSSTTVAPSADTTPDAFDMADEVQVPQNSVVARNVTITGINTAAPVSIVGGEYSVGCTGTFTSGAGTVGNGQQICVRHTSASAPNTSVTTTLTVGGYSDSYRSTTAGTVVVTGPNAFQFVDQGNTCFFRDAVSAPVTISGLSGPAAVSVSGGAYKLNNGLFTSQPGTVNNGDVLIATHVTASTANTVTNTTVTINGVSDTFSSTTAADNVNCGGNTGGSGGTVNDVRGRPLSFASSQGTVTNLRRLNGGPNTAPAGLSYPFGFFGFDVSGLAPGATATVTITLPAGETADSVVKCIGLNCAEYSGATITGNVIALTLTDGGAGDADGTANGTIVDPVAPAAKKVTLSSRSGGGALPPMMLLVMLPLALWRRRRQLAVPLAFLFCSGPAAAEAGDFYLGVRGGVAQNSMDAARLSAELRQRGYNATATVDESDAGWSVHGGWWLEPGFALEVTYADLGEYESTVTAVGANPAALRADFMRLRPLSPQLLALSARWQLPLAGEWLSFSPRLGLFGWRDKVRLGGESETDEGAGVLVALGLDARLASQLSLNLGGELYRLDSKQVITQLYGGVEYRY